MVEDGITVTYPNGAEGFVVGETEVIRWDDASQSTQSYTAEYSIDNGSTWNNIASNIPYIKRQWSFLVPAVSTDQALIRISRGSQSDVSDNTFSIFPEIQNLSVLFECPDSVGLQWTPVAGANCSICNERRLPEFNRGHFTPHSMSNQRCFTCI